MPKSIHKYQFDFGTMLGETIVQMPSNGQILHVGTQQSHALAGPKLTIWALVDLAERLSPRRIAVFGTGQTLPDDLRAAQHIGTLQLPNAGQVLHFFDLGHG